MKATIGQGISTPVVDPQRPWKLPRLNFEFAKYPYKKSAAEWKALLAKAAQSDAEAEFEVAATYDYGCKTGRGRVLVRRSAAKGLAWYRRAAEHGSAGAQNNLGVVLGGNHGIKRDTRKALFWLKKALRGGDAVANNIAITYRESGNFREAVRWFKKAVKEGDAGAWVQLGIHYYWGKGIRPDRAAAVRCFRRATRGKYLCEADRDDAYFYLGIAYLEGKGVGKSLQRAQTLFERANKDNDHPAAQRLLKGMARKPSTR